MSYETVLYEPIGRVVKITMNRPEKMNAINGMLAKELAAAFEAFEKDPELWVAVLTGAGERSFSAGGDLKAMASGEMDMSGSGGGGMLGLFQNFITKPVIAAVNGFALGGGTELAMSCDLIVASEKANLGLPEVKRGIIAGGGGVLRLQRHMPLKVAMYYIMTGEPMTAEEACRWGLVNKVVPHDQVVSAAIAMAEKICESAPLSVRISKEIAYRSLDVSLTFPPTAWEINSQFMGKLMQSEDAKEGPRAFAEKRMPVWKGR